MVENTHQDRNKNSVRLAMSKNARKREEIQYKVSMTNADEQISSVSS